MRKNVAGQVIGAQMISASDGSAFTGSVTCSVTGDGGTQATGSVSSGACTHKGNGFHTYAPAQAETNYDHIAFTFTGSGAVPVTVQVYTTFPQTGDSYARIGEAGAGLTEIPWNSAWDAEVQSEVSDALNAYDPPTNAEMVARTLPAASYATATALATVDSNVDAILEDTGATLPSTLSTIAGYIDTEVAAIKAVTDNLPDSGALTSLASASALATVDSVVDAIKAKTDSLTFTITGQVDANAKSMNDTAIDGTGTSEDKWRGAT